MKKLKAFAILGTIVIIIACICIITTIEKEERANNKELLQLKMKDNHLNNQLRDDELKKAYLDGYKTGYQKCKAEQK